jgi:hypothetical protein
MVFRALSYAINRVKDTYTGIIYNIKYTPCKSSKIPLKLGFVFLFFRDNLVNLLCEFIVNCEKDYSKRMSFSILLIRNCLISY